MPSDFCQVLSGCILFIFTQQQARVDFGDCEGQQREARAQLTEPNALPEPDRDRPMPADQFDALVRAARWTALTPSSIQMDQADR